MLNRSKHVSVIVTLNWSSFDATHSEQQFFERINLSRDSFPGSMAEQLDAAANGTMVSQTISPQEASLDYEQAMIKRIKPKQFQPELLKAPKLEPYLGRFYPRAFITGVAEINSSDRRPCRVIAKQDDQLSIDLNHPLAQTTLELQAVVTEILDKQEHGGHVTDIITEMTQNGPGMQARLADADTDFLSADPFRRIDDRNDDEFYQSARFVQHLDGQAITQISKIYQRFLQPGMRVLDLMSSWVSHLPKVDAIHVSALGMNAAELEKNPQLNDYVVHDLNQNPILPFANDEYDLVVCTASIEYLIKPLEVLKDIQRIVKPGGRVVFTFSDRWFPTKAIYIWTEIHPFERMGLVLSYFRQGGGFSQLGTESIQHYPRPQDDKYAEQRLYSDPVYAVWATVEK